MKMKIRTSIVIMSHLSDVQEMLNMLDDHKFASAINDKVNFAKYVLMKSNGNVNQEIDADEMYNKFLNWRNK